MIGAGQLDVSGTWDVLGEIGRSLQGEGVLLLAVEHERRHPDRRQDVAHVTLAVHAAEGDHRTWAGALPNRGRKRLLLFGGRTRSERLGRRQSCLPSPPSALELLVVSPRLLVLDAERIVRSPALARERTAEGKSPRTLGIRRGEEDAHRAALRDADQRCPLRADGVHDRPNVVHAGL